MKKMQFNYCDLEQRRRPSRLWARIEVGVGLIGLLVTCGSLGFGAPSAKRANCAAERSTAAAEVPLRIYKDNLIVVRATIGTKNLNMVLDTGTNPSIITPELSDRLKLAGKTESLQTINGTTRTQSVTLPCLQIGPLRASPIRVIVQNLRFAERSLGLSLGGVAGLDILGTRSFTIDYRKKKIVVGPIAPSEKTVRFEKQEPFLAVKVMIEGHPVRMLVDSGPMGLMVYRNRLHTTQEPLRFDSDAWVAGPGRITRIRWFRASVSLGKDSLGARNVAIADLDSEPEIDFDGLLGFGNMGFHKLSFDFENGLFGWE